MFLLIQNEWIKLFKRRGTYVMIGLLLSNGVSICCVHKI